MATIDPTIREISRDKLFSIFKSEELVRLFEALLYAVRTTLPGASDAALAALAAHIADLADAHQASAIGNTPAGGISSNTVQAALNELDTEKQPLLVSGTTIKTINGSPILGSGDLVVTAAAAGYARSFMLMGA